MFLMIDKSAESSMNSFHLQICKDSTQKIGSKANRAFKATTVFSFFVSIQLAEEKKLILSSAVLENDLFTEQSFIFIIFLVRLVCRELKAKVRTKMIQNFNHNSFSFSYSLRDHVAISPFAHHQQPTRCRALGGIRNVATRVY